MDGGIGDDIYIVDNTSDTIIENAASGTDTIEASVSFSIAGLSYVENLTLIGNATIGTGNSLNNIINGNAQNNTLNGGAGNDTLNGGSGNDTLDGSLTFHGMWKSQNRVHSSILGITPICSFQLHL